MVMSNAGTMSPNVDAANIMPAQYPNIVSFHLCGNFFKKKPIIEPNNVVLNSPIAQTHNSFI